MTIEYDTRKNRINLAKHHISIPELATIFNNPFAASTMDIEDYKHSSNSEKRHHAYGWTTTGWFVVVWYCYRGDAIRIIGGRKLK